MMAINFFLRARGLYELNVAALVVSIAMRESLLQGTLPEVYRSEKEQNRKSYGKIVAK